MNRLQSLLDEHATIQLHGNGQDSILTKNSWNGVDADIEEKLHAAAMNKTLSDVRSLVESHTASKNAINGNGDLSESGKAAKLRALITASDASLAKITKPMADKLSAKVHQSTTAIANAASSKPTVQDMLQHIEIRSQLANKDILEVEVLLKDLAQSGDHDQTIAAILGASPAAPLVRPQVAHEARVALIERAEPTHSADLKKATEHLATIKDEHKAAWKSFASHNERANLGGGLDPLANAAKGIDFNTKNLPGA